MPENRLKKPSSVCILLFRPALRADVKCGGATALSCFKIEPLRCPSSRHFAERKCFVESADQRPEALRGGWVNYPVPPRPCLLCRSVSGQKLTLAAIAHNGPNTASQPLQGAAGMPPDPQDGHKPPHRARHELPALRGWSRIRVYKHWQETIY